MNAVSRKQGGNHGVEKLEDLRELMRGYRRDTDEFIYKVDGADHHFRWDVGGKVDCSFADLGVTFLRYRSQEDEELCVVVHFGQAWGSSEVPTPVTVERAAADGDRFELLKAWCMVIHGVKGASLLVGGGMALGLGRFRGE
jgi:hypothetical protein